jgi:hypothetical protein
MTKSITALVVAASTVTTLTQGASPGTGALLMRRYQEGEAFHYRMTASNRGRTDTLNYAITANAIVKRDDKGKFFEELAWTDLSVGGQPFALPAPSQSFRQILTLEPNPAYIGVPNLSVVHPMLIGPITDLLTFYADILVSRHEALDKAGDHFYFPHGTPASWADGQQVTIGEDSIDFDVTLRTVDREAGTAVLVVRHMPGAKPQIRIPADWMRAPVADTPNNWVEVARTAAGKMTAAVGKETFDVSVTLGLADGRVLSAVLDNPVQVMERVCDDAALAQCGPPTRYEIHRHVEIVSMR